MLKRFLSTAAALAVLTTSVFPVCGYAANDTKAEKADVSQTETSKTEENQTESQTETPFKGFDLSFDDNAEKYGFTDILAASSGSTDKGKDGNGLSAGITHYLKMFDGAVDSGVYRYSFDIKIPSDGNLGAIMRVVGYDHGDTASGFDSDKCFESFYINKTFRYYNNLNGIKSGNWRTWKMSLNQTDLKVGDWNHIDMFFDMDLRFVYYYIDNKLLGYDKICPDLKEIYGIDFSVESGKCTLDNYKFEELDYKLAEELKENGTELKEELIAPLYVAFNETEFAYNFYGNSAEFDLTLKNDCGQDKEFTLNYQVVDDEGFVINEKSEKVTLAKDETKHHTTTISPGKYGLFTLRVNATADGLKGETNKKRRFALIKKPDEGVVNKKMNIHTLFGNDIAHRGYEASLYDAYKKAGFYGSRFDISRNGITNWNSWDGGAIDYGYYKPTMDVQKETGFDNMIILSGSSVYYNHIPVTDAELKDWYNYCHQVALDTKDIAGAYEIWNEPNASGFNVNATIEQYGKIVQIAHDAVKSVNPDALIIGCALSGTSDRWVGEAVKYAGQYMDAVSIHPYMWMQGPEAGGMFPQAQSVRKAMDENGMEGKPLWFTEIGWYSHVGTENVTAYTVEMFVLNEVYDMADRIYVFRYADGPTLPREGFGLLNAAIDNDPFMARPVFAALSAYNSLMTDCKYQETIDYGGGQNIYKFKLADGRDALVFWNKDKNTEIALDMGCDSVTSYDIYGNEDTVYGLDGKYQFSCTNMPRYIVGNFGDIKTCGELVEADKDLLEIVNHDKTDVTVKNLTDKDIKVKVSTTSDLSAEGEVKIGNEADNKEKSILITAGDISDNYAKSAKEGNGILKADTVTDVFDDLSNGAELSFYATDDGGEKLIYKKRIGVECVDPVHLVHYMEHFKGEWWQYVTEITNNTYDTTLDGKVDISAPTNFAKYIKSWNLGTVKAGETKKKTFPIPDFIDNSDLGFDAKLTMNNGFVVDMSRELSFRSIAKQKTPPVIDGVVSEGEWNTSYMIEMNDKSGNYLPLLDEWGGNNDLSAKIYMGFDDEKLYFAAEVTDDVHSVDPERGVWAGDSFQIATALEKSASAAYTELNIALIDGEPKISRSSSLVASLIANDIPHEMEIKRDEAKKLTTYELAILLNELYPSDFKIKDFSSVTMSILLNDKDSDDFEKGAEGRHGMFEFGSGIGTGKNPGLFIDFNLVR